MSFCPIFAHLFKRKDSVAQLVEQYTFNVWVLGSSPSRITTLNFPVQGFFFYIPRRLLLLNRVCGNCSCAFFILFVSVIERTATAQPCVSVNLFFRSQFCGRRINCLFFRRYGYYTARLVWVGSNCSGTIVIFLVGVIERATASQPGIPVHGCSYCRLWFLFQDGRFYFGCICFCVAEIL